MQSSHPLKYALYHDLLLMLQQFPSTASLPPMLKHFSSPNQRVKGKQQCATQYANSNISGAVKVQKALRLCTKALPTGKQCAVDLSPFKKISSSERLALDTPRGFACILEWSFFKVHQSESTNQHMAFGKSWQNCKAASRAYMAMEQCEMRA